MPIDSFTVLTFALFIKVLLGGLFVVFWLKSRDSLWFAWWGASLFLGSVTSIVFMLRVSSALESFLTIGIGNAALITALAFCWQGARAFEKRRPLRSAVLLPPILWLAACGVPAFFAEITYRIILSSALIATLLACAAVEFWRGRNERLPSRWPIIVVMGSFALSFAVRIPLISVLPFPFGSLPMQTGWIGAFNLLMFSHTMLLAVLIVALSKERLELDQRTKAQTDPLTGALNRRAFMWRGARLLHRHEREGAPLCLLFLDLDHFKSLNDRFGHSGGDDVLVSFVKVVNGSIRPTDFLFRIGGEEFCCLLPYTGIQHAHRVAERIRHQFELVTVTIAGAPLKATVSIGIASTEEFGFDLDTLMRRADMAVYGAKRQGRNRVEVAVGSDPNIRPLSARRAS